MRKLVMSLAAIAAIGALSLAPADADAQSGRGKGQSKHNDNRGKGRNDDRNSRNDNWNRGRTDNDWNRGRGNSNQNDQWRRDQERRRQEDLRRQQELRRQEELRRQQEYRRQQDYRRQQEQRRQEELRRQQELRNRQNRDRYGYGGSRQNEYDRRQQTKNEWRNIAIASGAVAILGLLNKDETLVFAGTAGALYSLHRYEQDRKSQNSLNRARADYFARDHFYRDGNRYERREVNRNGQRYYQFVRC